MKLQLKHIAPYLPYKLKCEVTNIEYDEVTLDYLDMISYEDKVLTFIKAIDVYLEDGEFAFCKPILQPAPFKNMASRDYTYNEWSFFFEQHFDVFELIPKGLAIDINELKKASDENKAQPIRGEWTT